MDRVCSGSLNNMRERGGGHAVLCMGVLFSVLYSEGVLYKVFCMLLTCVVTGSGVAPSLSFFFFFFFLFILHYPLCELSFQYGPYTRYLLNYG